MTDHPADSAPPQRPSNGGVEFGSQEQWQEAMLFHNWERTQLSNERTFLAWVRTSLALVTLGFVVQRFEVVLGGAHARLPRGLTIWVPMLFFILGGLIVALSTWEFFRVRKAIGRRTRMPTSGIRDGLIVTTLVFLLVVSAIFIATTL